MKNIKLILSFVLLAVVAVSCSIPDGIDQDTTVNTPASSNLNAVFNISNDNSGNVSITPTGESITKFIVDFGDGSGTEASTTLSPGDKATHSYPEGDFTVTVTGMNVAGEKTSQTFPLTVTYRAPENLTVTPTVTGYDVTVSADAQYANSYLVYYGDATDEVGTPMALGETLPAHTYAAAGTYDLKVVALSGGAATTETTVPVTIYDPFQLPITFDNPNANYFFGTFDDWGTQQFATVDNPNKSGIDTSDKVGSIYQWPCSLEWDLQPVEPILLIFQREK